MVVGDRLDSIAVMTMPPMQNESNLESIGEFMSYAFQLTRFHALISIIQRERAMMVMRCKGGGSEGGALSRSDPL